MMKIYICPDCGWIRPVSRRVDVECHKCHRSQMTLCNLDMETYSSMSEKERDDYVKGWLYIHGKRERKK